MTSKELFIHAIHNKETVSMKTIINSISLFIKRINRTGTSEHGQDIDMVKWNQDLERLIGEPKKGHGLKPLTRDEIYKDV